MQVTRLLCDVCGNEIPNGFAPESWIDCHDGKHKISLKTQIVTNGGVGGPAETREGDLCADCFHKALELCSAGEAVA